MITTFFYIFGLKKTLVPNCFGIYLYYFRGVIVGSEATSAFFDDLPRGNIALYRDAWFQNDTVPLNVEIKDVYDTREIDAYRQGVEITRLRHYDAGVVKIHAGEPLHILRKNRFGMDSFGRTKTSWYSDNEKFYSLNYMRAQDGAESFEDWSITYPWYLDQEIETESGKYDGVIEPLSIRSVLDRSTIDDPYEMHSMWGQMMGGMPDPWRASSLLLNIDYFETETKIIGFNDMGYFVRRQSSQGYFDDCYVNPLGKSDILVSPKKVSATSGWDFDNNSGVGTDSIAFGGMGY
jgi:hypothetical protein